MPNLPNRAEPVDSFKAGRKNTWFINLITPRGKKRPAKMKTSKKFEPIFVLADLDDQEVEQVFTQFFSDKRHLKNCIHSSRTKKVRRRRINSAIGPIVRFYLPEAYEFIIGHDERHLVQIEEVLEQIG